MAIDVEAPDPDQAFLPAVELIGELAATLEALAPQLQVSVDADNLRGGDALAVEVLATGALDVGCHSIWMNRPIDDVQNLKLMEGVYQEFSH